MSQFQPLVVSLSDASALLSTPSKTIRNRMSLGTWPLEKLPFSDRILFRLSDVYALAGVPMPNQPERDPSTIVDAENKPRRGRPRKINQIVIGK